MKRKKVLLLAMAALIIIGIPLFTKASEARDGSSIKSTGNIVYKSNDGSVEMYAEDIAFLQERLASVPDEIFSPVLYSHSHSWKYIDITSKQHTRHCAGCGSSHDIVEAHKATTVRSCMISYNDKEYVGSKKRCECGYEWEEEMYHNLVYSSSDDTSHMISCALSGTAYCSGMAARKEDHNLAAYTTDDSHHLESCMDCDFTGKEQECVFDEKVIEEGDDGEEERRYCICGNYIVESSGGGDEPTPEVPDPGEEWTETEQLDLEGTEENSPNDLAENVSDGGIL